MVLRSTTSPFLSMRTCLCTKQQDSLQTLYLLLHLLQETTAVVQRSVFVFSERVKHSMALDSVDNAHNSNFRFPWFCMFVDGEVGGNTCSLAATLHSNPLVATFDGKRRYISFNPIPIVSRMSRVPTSIHAR